MNYSWNYLLSFHVFPFVFRLQIFPFPNTPVSPSLSSSLLSFFSWGARADLLPEWRWPSLPRIYFLSPSGGGLLCLWASWWRRAGAQPTYPIIYWNQVHVKHDLWNPLIVCINSNDTKSLSNKQRIHCGNWSVCDKGRTSSCFHCGANNEHECSLSFFSLHCFLFWVGWIICVIL